MTARPTIPPPPHRGGCLCGSVRYCLDGRPIGINACHCRDCQKLTGATNLLMIFGWRRKFEWEAGEVDRWRKRADSGSETDIVRCRVCGTRLWHERLSSPEFVFVAAGTLDDPGWAVPVTHIWAEKAVPAVRFVEDALRIEGQPESRQVLIDAFASVYGAN